MRRTLFALALLAACQMTAPDKPPVAGVMPGDEISVTSLDAPAAGPADTAAAPEAVPAAVAGADAPRPKPRPGAAAEPVASEPAAEPAAPKSAEQLLCEKTGGQWAVAGKTGANICVKPTRDGGKICHRKTDCAGQCLARSGTCAPFTPLFGCNEILEKDGRRVTLCID